MSFTDDWFEENILIKWNNILEKQEYIDFLLQKIDLKNPGDKSSTSTSIYKEVLSNLDGCYNCLVAVIKVLKNSVDASKTNDEESTDNKNEHHTSLSGSDPSSIDLISHTSAQFTNETGSEYKPQSPCEPQSEPADLLQKPDFVSLECPTNSHTLTNSVIKVAPSLNCGNSFKEENYGMGPDLKQLTLSSTVKVSVCIVMTPYCFWVQLTETAESNLIQLAKDISEHISSENCRRIRQPFAGMKCLAPYNDGCFYRAKIVNICEPNKEDSCKVTKVNVLYIDYGNTEVVSSDCLQEMPYSLSQLPCQAICCSLANIAPVDIQNDWSINISDIFQKLVSYSVLLCIPKISCTDGFPQLVHLYPIDFPSASSLQLYSISLQLISKNCAVYIPISEQINLICNILKTWVLFNQQPLLDSTEEDSISVTSYRNDDITRRQYHDGNINQQIRSAFTKRMECSTIYEEPSEDFEEENCLNVNVDQCEHSTSQTSPEKMNYQISPEMSNCQAKPKICNSQTSPEKSLSESSTLPCTNVTIDNKEGTLESCCSEPLPKQSQTTGTSTKNCNTYSSETEKIHAVVFSYVSTPSDFYVYLINSATIERLADLVKSLNEKFLSLKPTELLELSDTLKIEINSLCCCYDKTDQSYHRGIIIDFKSAQKPNKMSVKVFYIDYGYIAWIARRHIYPLSTAYKKFPALAVHCTLARICPVGQKPHPSDTYIWPEKAKKAFKKNINFKDSYVMKIVSGNLPSTSFSFQQYLSPPLQVLIATLSDNKTESVKNPEICINYELVRLNHATLTEKSAELELLNWDPMSVDYTSRRNRYEINIDDAQIATQGFMVNDEKTICKFYRENQKCKLGSKCPYKHIRVPEDCLTVDKREAVCKNDTCSEFELPLVGSLVGVEVSAIINPAHFYLILPWGKDAIKDLHDMPDYENKEETLADLQKDLQDFYKLSFPNAEENLFWGIGELVAARAVVDQDWYRARICEVNDVINEVKVFFIDFGNVQWIPESNIQPLASQFTHLPHQSVECCLNGIVSASDNGLWTQEAKDYFLELVDDKVLVASIKAIMCRRMYIDLYDTYQTPEKNIADELIHAGVAKRSLSADGNLSAASNLTLSMNYIPG